MEVHEDDPAEAGGAAVPAGEAPRASSPKIATSPMAAASGVEKASARSRTQTQAPSSVPGEDAPASSRKISTSPTADPSTIPAAASGVGKTSARSRAQTPVGSAPMAASTSPPSSVPGEDAPAYSPKISTSPTADPSTVPAAASGVGKTSARSRAQTPVGSAPGAPSTGPSSLVRRVNAGMRSSSGHLANSEGNSAAQLERSVHPLQESTSLAPLKVAADTPKPPAYFRVITAPMRAAPAQDMWSCPVASGGEVNYSEEFEKLTKSVVTMASGLGKLFSGFRLKVVSKEEKEQRATAERKAMEQKKLEEEMLIAEQQIIADKFGPAKVDEWKRKKQEQDAVKRKEEEKERMMDFLLSVPGHLVDVSNVFEGVSEAAYGGRDTAVVMGQMVRGIPSLMRRYFSAPPAGGLTGTSVMGTGSCGLRMALDRHIVTRSYDSRIAVIDGFGRRKETIPRVMGGRLVITNTAELSKAIAEFRAGRLSQILDIDPEQVTFATAHDLWCLLCNEELTGLLSEDSSLPEIALRASALMQEEEAVKAHLKDSEQAVNELKSCVDILGQKLRRSTAKERRKEKCD
ncbi:unnamed protein product [Urochloa humidicola]